MFHPLLIPQVCWFLLPTTVGTLICLRERSGTTVCDEVAGTGQARGHGATLNKLMLFPLQCVSTAQLFL
ncbi:MAG: hypothetical protein EZS28_033285 [Streblomastix strix]|uniref:Secreted protein n=1 Tax=Streblomastix strix TaxID=222440 RepID=A0A5J4UL09_9EUKA|nr:MAG: hypothetical protein EZS28_033285 [Streblomastix strix]